MILSGVLIVVIAMVVGLGVGHFLGWSERLELQEFYAEVREERLEELTDSLVSCMTGEEGKGGDDQDLDDRVIQQLWDENRELKEELEMLKNAQEADSKMKIEGELNAILRDRVNDLMEVNAELEKELAKMKAEKAEQPPPVRRQMPSVIEYQSAPIITLGMGKISRLAMDHDSNEDTIINDEHEAELEDEVDVDLEVDVDVVTENQSQIIANNFLRERVNELMEVNTDLEKQLAWLKAEKDDDDDAMKVTLNEFAHENEALKLALAKARYTQPPQSRELQESKVWLNEFANENEALKLAVIKARYGQVQPVESGPKAELNDGLKHEERTKNNINHDKYDETFEIQSENRFQMDKVPKEQEDHVQGHPKRKRAEVQQVESDHKAELNELRVENDGLKHEIRKIRYTSPKNNFNHKENEHKMFSFFDGFIDLTDKISANLTQKIFSAVAQINSKVGKILPDEKEVEVMSETLKDKYEQIKTLARSSEGGKKVEKAIQKMSKTLIGTLDRIKNSMKDFKGKSWEKIRFGLEKKWTQVWKKFNNSDKKDDEKKVFKNKEKKMSNKNYDADPKNGNTSQWIFLRAKERKEMRDNAVKSDWLFDRAKERQKIRHDDDDDDDDENDEDEDDDDDEFFRRRKGDLFEFNTNLFQDDFFEESDFLHLHPNFAQNEYQNKKKKWDTKRDHNKKNKKENKNRKKHQRKKSSYHHHNNNHQNYYSSSRRR